MLRFATVGVTASKMIQFQRERSLASFVWPQQSRCYMSNKNNTAQTKSTEGIENLMAQAETIEVLKIVIKSSPDPVIKKLYASVLQSVETYQDDQAATKLGSHLGKQQDSGLKLGTFASKDPPVNGLDGFSLAEIRNNNLLILWDMMKVAGKLDSDFPELQQVYGLKSIVLLRDLFLSFQVTFMEFSIPLLAELNQLEWHEKIRNWSEDGPYGLDLTTFRCMQVFDLEVKRLNLKSFLKKKFGFDELDDFLNICSFVQTWKNVTSLEARRLGMYYVTNDEGKINSGFKLLSLFGKSGSSSTKSIDSDLMLSNARKIAACLS